ncbi:UNVERIFIED_CONTAM: hypothetical protein Sradi_1546200 [Sesamum radiatum]|uniref:Transposase n=1 Tax=Sesamum radiatum TaxID=300843 RepID=A0AAW2UAT2_SESRA
MDESDDMYDILEPVWYSELRMRESANDSTCKICGASRWKKVENHLDESYMSDDVANRKGHRIPLKVLRHFPLVQRLQRLYMASETASHMRWHDEGRLKDALRRTLPKIARTVLIDLCGVFKELCSKVFDTTEFERIESQTIMTLCELEKLFPPSFFDVMVHLVIHLVEEARIAGPVHYRWMYPIERYLGHLKTYVRNRSRPEGSIAEGYLAEECLNFCSAFLNNTVSEQPCRNHDLRGSLSRNQKSIFSPVGYSLGKTKLFVLDQITRLQAHRYVLFNSHIVRPFLDEYHSILRVQMPYAQKMEIDRIHQQTFHTWFTNQVEKLSLANNGLVNEELQRLARGPKDMAKRLKGFVINGVKFHTKSYELNRRTQTSGVMVNAKTLSYASSKDKNPIEGVVTKKEDEHAFTLGAPGERLSDDPFVLASQAEQVFYVQDPVDTRWHVVNKAILRGFYDMLGHEFADDVALWERLDNDSTIRPWCIVSLSIKVTPSLSISIWFYFYIKDSRSNFRFEDMEENW